MRSHNCIYFYFTQLFRSSLFSLNPLTPIDVKTFCQISFDESIYIEIKADSVVILKIKMTFCSISMFNNWFNFEKVPIAAPLHLLCTSLALLISYCALTPCSGITCICTCIWYERKRNYVKGWNVLLWSSSITWMISKVDSCKMKIEIQCSFRCHTRAILSYQCTVLFI